jgi:ferredoxin
MAKIIFKGKEINVPDNSNFDLMSDYGFFFSCNSGVCGICKAKVLKGMDNLNSLTEEEEFFGLEENERLLCQCKIKQGTVEIDEG